VAVLLALGADADLEAGAASHERGMGDKKLMEGDLKGAMAHFNKAVEMNPKDHLNFYKRATAHLIDKKYKSALSDLTKTLELSPGYAQALDKRAKIYLIEGKFGAATEDYEALIKAKPNDQTLSKKLNEVRSAETASKQAEHAKARQNWVGAREHLTKALDVASECVSLLVSRAECHMKLGDAELALQDTGKALKQQKSNIQALELRGMAYYGMMEFELAQRHFREGLRTDPDHQGCKKAYRTIKKMENTLKNGEEEMREGKYADALETFQMGAKVDPEHRIFVARMNLGQCQAQVKLSLFREAVQSCSRVMDLPEHLQDRKQRVQTLLERAEALQGLEDWEEAIRDCERALHLDQKDGNTKRKLDHAKRMAKKSKMKDWYRVLGVSKDADERTIKKAYKKMALSLHPDKVCAKNACKSEEDTNRANQRFHEVATAHEILTDPEKKAKFDRGEDPLDEQPQGGRPGGFNPFGGPGGPQFTFHFG